MSFQPGFRHLCNVLQINDHDLKTHICYAKNIKMLVMKDVFKNVASALNWLKNEAPDEFKFTSTDSSLS